MIKLVDLVARSDWNDVQVELEREELTVSPMMNMDFLYLYSKLLKTEPLKNPMRIIIKEIDLPEVAYESDDDEEELMLTVFGKNGMLNKEFKLFHYSDEAGNPVIANAEAEFSLNYTPWENWLGMDIDSETLKERTRSNIVAISMWGMTLESFDEAEIQLERERIEERLREYEAMSPVEKIDELALSSASLFLWEKELHTWKCYS